jgi:hypothetical protein
MYCKPSSEQVVDWVTHQTVHLGGEHILKPIASVSALAARLRLSMRIAGGKLNNQTFGPGIGFKQPKMAENPIINIKNHHDQ